MSGKLDPEDAELDRLWRQRYGQPLPLRGCGELAWQILGVSGGEGGTKTFASAASAPFEVAAFGANGAEEGFEMPDQGGGHVVLF